MFYTAHPERDSLAHDDEQERLSEIAEAHQAREHKRLSDAFIDAAPWGPDEPLEKSTVSEALYELHCDRPELLDQIIQRALRLDTDPVWRAMRQELADAWANIKLQERQ